MLLATSLSLASLATLQSPFVDSETADDFLFARSLAAPGDVNGDGVPDVAIGQAAPPDGAGCVWLVSGKDGAPLRRIEPERPDDRFGHPIAAVGDLDGDGVGDLAVGSESTEGVNPRVTLVSGAEGRAIWQRELPVTTGLTWGAEGHPVFWPGLPVPEPGWIFLALVGLGDVDGDGVSDLAVGVTPACDERQFAGLVLILSGRDASPIRAFPGARGGDRFGSSLAWGGDADADGTPDLAVGASKCYRRNYVRVISVRNGHVLHQLEGSGSDYGEAITWVGDADGDGHDDLAIGSPRDCDDPGAFVEVRSGKSGEVLRTLLSGGGGFGSALASGCFFEPSRIDMLVGAADYGDLCSGAVVAFTLETGDELYTVRTRRLAHFGASVCPMGDVDGDGRTDFVAGTDHTASRDEGWAALVSGGTGELRWSVTAAGLRELLEPR